jgi:ribosomal protein S18 acetylase RimI-like enzyme
MQIRYAKFEDIESLVKLLSELFAIEEDFEVNEVKQRQGLKMLLENTENNILLVAENDNEIIGFVSVQVIISTAEGGKVGLLEDMIIKSKYRSMKIGTKLINKMMKISKEKGLLRLQLFADKNNKKALDFYKKTGWTQTQLIYFRYKH